MTGIWVKTQLRLPYLWKLACNTCRRSLKSLSLSSSSGRNVGAWKDRVLKPDPVQTWNRISNKWYFKTGSCKIIRFSPVYRSCGMQTSKPPPSGWVLVSYSTTIGEKRQGCQSMRCIEMFSTFVNSRLGEGATDPSSLTGGWNNSLIYKASKT